MNKNLLVSWLMLVGSAVAAPPEDPVMTDWLTRDQSGIARIFMVGGATLRGESTAQATALAEYKSAQTLPGQSKTYLSTRLLFEFDCKFGTQRLQSIAHYTDLGGGGEMIASGKSSAPLWKRLDAGNPAEMSWRAACQEGKGEAFTQAYSLGAGSEWRDLYRKGMDHYLRAEYEPALAAAQKAFDLARKTVGADHPDVATSVELMALALEAQGKYTKAELYYLASIGITEKWLGPQHLDLAERICNLANFYIVNGDPRKAEAPVKRCVAIQEAGAPDPVDLVPGLSNLALLHTRLGEFDKATPLYRRVVDILEKSPVPDQAQLATSYTNLATNFAEQSDHAAAETWFARALAIREKITPVDHPDTALALVNLAQIYSARDKFAKALPLYDRSLAMYIKTQGANHPYVATTLTGRAKAHEKLGNRAEAEADYLRAIAIQEKMPTVDPAELAENLNSLGQLYFAQDNFAKAEPLFTKALGILEKAFEPDSENIADTLKNLAGLYRKTKREAEANKLEARANGILAKLAAGAGKK